MWREDSLIIVAMANPVDVLALDDLRSFVGSQVKPVMAEGAQILALIERMGHSDTRVHETIQAAVGENREVIDPAAAVEVASGDDKAPLVQFIDLLLAKAIQEGASDIHIEPTSDELRIRFRVDGVLHEAMSPPRSLEAGIISRVKVMADIDIAERRLPQDGRLTAAGGGIECDARVVTIPTVHGEAAVIRLLRNTAQVGVGGIGFLPEQLDRYRRAYERPWGAILVTGPTGSGKSTTLYATLDELRDPTRNIVTIEDPVEYRMDGIKQVQVNQKAGMTFARALRSFLRADPDVMLVGEIRDGETATMAVEASLTGHLVLSTLHTNNSASAPMRLIEMGVEPFLVSSALSAVLAQRLARRLCEKCREPFEIHLDRLGLDETSLAALPPELTAQSSFSAFQAVGCEACGDTGYRGRFAIHEVLTVTEEIAELVLDRGRVEDVEKVAVEQGMSTLRADGLRKVKMGLTTVEELFRVIS